MKIHERDKPMNLSIHTDEESAKKEEINFVSFSCSISALQNSF
ncbi:hypothetical protein [Flavobacterium sp. ZT3R18]|nr:hypothetical protein [Flavobacterium sp. ZT3R18]